ncbi:MAG: chemotaxis protein CheB [Bdellovibrionales bacterium]|nr:chemotaxis protein CheB [Bdellovibrionales bacterium]
MEQGNSGISGKKNLKPVKNLEAMFIGTSTGGVQTLEAILRELGPLPFPVFVMIHMPGQFTREFAKRLNSTYSAFEVIHVERDTQMEKKAVYLGCGDNHFMIFEGEGGFKIKVVHGEKVKGFCPNIDFAFKSLAKNKCRRVGAGILTGMGRDGAQGLLEIKDAGGFTYCQDEDTSVVYGMPKAAKEIGAQQAILNPKQIARWFNDRS